MERPIRVSLDKEFITSHGYALLAPEYLASPTGKLSDAMMQVLPGADAMTVEGNKSGSGGMRSRLEFVLASPAKIYLCTESISGAY
jgi:hypothetical protein